MPNCKVNNCTSRQGSCPLFSAPKSPPETRELWLDFIRLSGAFLFDENSLFYICENHFLPSNFKPSKGRSF